MTLKSDKQWNILNRVEDASEIIDAILKQRDVKNEDTFLNPKLEDVPSYKKLYDVKKAIKKIKKSIDKGEKIYIHGDFDVDGISATSLLWKFIYKEVSKKIGKQVDILPYIPDRVDEGYGLSNSSLDSMINNGAKLIITVDCGVRDRVLIEEYIEKYNVDIIITDHHQPPEDIDEVKYTVVHQMFPNKEFVEQKICGSAVIYFLIQGLIDEYEIDLDNTYGLDLVALATVADMMPLLGLNRVFVKYGLEQMRENKRLGLTKLLYISGVDPKDLDSYHLGFVIGPRINAAGRIGNAMDALRLLSTDNTKQAIEISSKLNNLNILRQENTKEILDKALEQYEDQKENNIFVAVGDNWHEGIVGLVAGKIFERINKPTIVITKNNNEIRGSARSISEFNITKALEKNKKYLEKYGGHVQAAGFTVKENKLEELITSLTKYANKHIKEDMLKKDINIDISVPIELINIEIINIIDKLKPFGYGNNRPLIALENIEIINKYPMKGNQHMKLKAKGSDIDIVMFNCDEDIDSINISDNINIYGYLDINIWNGNKTLQFQVKGYSDII